MTSVDITPQFDEQAERAILGALLNSPQDALGGVDSLSEDSFYLSSHRVVWRARANVCLTSSDVDLLMIRAQLEKTGELSGIGGLAYLLDLQDSVPTRGFNPEDAVRRILEAWKRRRGLDLCHHYSTRLNDRSEDSAEVLADMQGEVFDILQDAPGQVDPHVSQHTVAALNEFLSPEPPAGDSYGHPQVDEITGGMKPKQVTVVGAWSGVGKSSLMCQATVAACMRGDGVDLFSFEMPREDVIRRLWAIVSGVPYTAIYRKRCNVTERERVKVAAMQIAEWPLRIHDDSRMTLSQVSSLARLSARRNGMRLFCVDYAQIVPGEGKDTRLIVSNVSRTLTALAKAEGVHLMLLSQLSKPGGVNPGRPPRLSDLRETGQLENDAHVVLLLHRPWDEQTGGLGHGGEIIIPKQRNGATGTIASNFNARTLTFE